ncbi:MAG TPA: class I SAM-dependent methyltransferase [Dehalococcoidia bacterium]|nr:class I SAM-dependent methyltransferase [Dehalococcoidia bacterium]
MPDDDLRTTFDRVAALYDRSRPTYPPELFADLVALAGLTDGARILEIGCGTGQATVPLAERGYRLTAVELGANLARIARQNLARFPHVSVDNAAFEEWPLPDEPFDLVFAATSFHWLDHAVAVPKIARALRAGGHVAIIGGGHVAGGSMEFFSRAQACYEAHMPGTPPGLRPRPADEISPDVPEITNSGLFGEPRHRRYTWLRDFTMRTYIGELNTYSNHIALSEEDRRALLECVARLIDGDFGGRVTKAYLTDLLVAPRL